MLKTILSVSGKPGLYKMISQGKNLLIIESLTDKKRIPAYTRDKVISLGDIAIYTNDEEVPLYKILNKIKEKENLRQIPLDISKATPDELRTYLASVLPEFDRERVYPTDIKRLINWYHILLEVGITEFDPEDEAMEKPEDVSEPEDKIKKPKEEAKAKKTATSGKVTASQKAAASTKQQPAAGKIRQRTKQK